ncbi:MAG TPA: hypothetical protein VN083_09760, partial [Vicinamibacteria bacterium]|nr:hypothetical protein [Vicinamibacteria bacterium]
FALWSLDRFWEVRSARRALGVALCLLLQGLSSIYLGVITATTLGLAILVGVLGGLGGRAFLRLALSLAAAGLFLLPTLRPYLRMRSFEGKEWSLAEIGRFATTPESYAASATRLYGPLTERHADDSRTREPLFPGAVPLVLGVAGLAVAPRRYRAVALGMTGLAFVLSLGPSTAVYRFLYDHVLVFRGVRALNRFSLVPALALSVLSGLALSGRRWRGLALVAAMIEATNVPLGYGLYAPPPPSARWLAGKEGAVAYLPLGERDTEVMLEGIAHFRPLLNGDSGFVPVPYDREMELFEGGVTEEGRRLLRALDVQHVVARTDLSLPLAARFGEDRIYTVPLGEAAQFVSGGTPAPSLWSSAGATADLGVPRTIDRVLFEIGAGSWDDAPSVALSKDGHVWEHVRARASFADAILSLTRDPRHARGELRFPSREARFVRFDRRVPAAPGIVWVAP